MLEARRRGIKAICAALWGMVGVLVAALLALSIAPGAAEARDRVLVFSATKAFRHDSIPAGVTAIRELGARHGFAVTATENASWFTDPRLRRFAVVVFLSTTGDVLDDAQQTAFRRYIRRGGGFAGVHAAADTEYGWDWYGRLLGARFLRHPAVQPATILPRRRPPSPVDPLAAAALASHGRVVRLPRAAAGGCACWRGSTSRPTRAGRWARGTRSRGAAGSTAAGPGTRRSATPRPATPSRASGRTCSAGSAGRRVLVVVAAAAPAAAAAARVVGARAGVVVVDRRRGGGRDRRRDGRRRRRGGRRALAGALAALGAGLGAAGGRAAAGRGAPAGRRAVGGGRVRRRVAAGASSSPEDSGSEERPIVCDERPLAA